MLPGGMRVVEEMGTTAMAGLSDTLPDGTLITTGMYGDSLSGASQSQLRTFSVQSQAVIDSESKIAITTGDAYFANLAAHNGAITPSLAADAGRMVLNPVTTLTIDPASVFDTAPAAGGRGAEVDIGGTAIDIMASLDNAPADGALHVTAASLTSLNADSLLVGGTRTDNADGTTSLNVTANSILVGNDGTTPLSSAEILLASNGTLTIADGADILAQGTLTDARTGDYLMGDANTAGSGTGALVRVSTGQERLVTRTNGTTDTSLAVGAATLSGNAVLLDSSGASALSGNVAIPNAKFVALDAPRIGFNADPATYNGLVISDALKNLLTQSGAQLTLRSGSSIDFADGTYTFGALRLDANSLSGLDGGAVTINAGTVGLSNVGAAGTVCTDCAPGNGTLAINANQILFTGGSLSLQNVVLAADTSSVISTDVIVTLPAGTIVTIVGVTGALLQPVRVKLPQGNAMTLLAGTKLVDSDNGTLAAGTTVNPTTDTAATTTLENGNTYSVVDSFQFPGYGSVEGGQNATLGADTTVAVPSGTPAILNNAAATSAISFFGGGVTLTAQNGVLAQGAGSRFDAGTANLTLHTPYLGDFATPVAAGVNPTIPSLILNTAGALVIDNVGVGAPAAVTGTPGAALTLNGQSVSITGTDVRATGGTLNISSATGIAIGAGTILEAPGYSKNFGDDTDPFAVDAPGGLITLNAGNGDIALTSGSTVSLGGDSGNGGSITLNAASGQVSLAGTVIGAPGGASLTVNSGGAFDLSTFATASGAGFDGDIAIESGSGNLALAAGDSLKAADVSLTADGGVVDIAGTIDVSGINGGNVDLFGTSGAALEGTAQILARATGYGPTDTRQASGGNVTLGSGFISSSINAGGYQQGDSGPITIASGAVIDVSALNTQPRIVEGEKNGITTYNYVAADQGGSVTLRAPLIGADGAGSVNIAVADAGSIKGAASIVVEGYRAYDLGAIGSGGQFVGVDTTTTPGTAILDTTATGLPNFLADEAPGTLPTFIQNFDISSSYGNLGGLASQSNFHARPGVELDYNGDIMLASNWNFAAGVVDTTSATSAGLMTTSPATGELAIIPGDEAAVLADFTHMLYRVGGTAFGEPGELSIRAKGNLTINGSITDGFFTFGDQTDTAYLNTATGASVYNATFNTTCTPSCTSIGTFTGSTPPTHFNIVFTGATDQLAGGANLVPYDAAANTPGALGSGTGGQGDPIGSAEIFPLIQGSNGPQPVQSWSYQLTGGAKTGSANPAQVQTNATGGVIVQGSETYTYGGVSGSLSSTVQFKIGTSTVGLNALGATENLSANSAVALLIGANANIKALVSPLALTFFQGLPKNPDGSNKYVFTLSAGQPTLVYTTYQEAVAFMQYLAASPQWQQQATSAFPLPGGGSSGTPALGHGYDPDPDPHWHRLHQLVGGGQYRSAQWRHAHAGDQQRVDSQLSAWRRADLHRRCAGDAGPCHGNRLDDRPGRDARSIRVRRQRQLYRHIQLRLRRCRR